MERIYSQDNYNVSHKRFSKPKRKPGRPAIQNNEPPVKCFVCDEKITRQKVNLVLGNSSSKSGFPSQISQLLGDEFLIIVQEDDYLCKNCVTLLNSMDKLENQLSAVKDTLVYYLKKKYNLAEETGKRNEKITEEPRKMLDVNDDNSNDDHVERQMSELYSEESIKSTLFKCTKCEFNTYSQYEFSKHKNSHISSLTKRQYSDNSNSTFGDSSNHSRFRLYKCSVCFKIFVAKIKCIEHMKISHLGIPLSSNNNNDSRESKSFDNDSVFYNLKGAGSKIDRQYYIKNDLFFCNSCSASFINQSDFNSHKCDFSCFNEQNSSLSSKSMPVDLPSLRHEEIAIESDKNYDLNCSSSSAIKLKNNVVCNESASIPKVCCKREENERISHTYDDDDDCDDIGAGSVDYAEDDSEDNQSDISGDSDEDDDSDDPNYEPPKHICGNCGFKSDLVSLREHFEIRSQRDLICSICGQSFDSYCKLMKHSSGHDINSRPYHCIYCADLKVPDLLSLNYHMKKKHLNLIDEKICNTCKKIFPNLEYLEKHILDKHCTIDDSKEHCDVQTVKSNNSVDRNYCKDDSYEPMMQDLIVSKNNSAQLNPFSGLNENFNSPDSSAVVNKDKCSFNLNSVVNMEKINSLSPSSDNCDQLNNLININKAPNCLGSESVGKRENFSDIDKISDEVVNNSNSISGKNLDLFNFSVKENVNGREVKSEDCITSNIENHIVSDEPMDTSVVESSDVTESSDFVNTQAAVSIVYKCAECGLQKSSKKELVSHFEIHTDNMNVMFCNICNHNFNDIKQFQLHRNKHSSKSQNRLCPFCNETCYDGINLKYHVIKYHSFNVKHLYCNVCEKRYSSTIQFKKHFMSHNKLGTSREYYCKKCNRDFNFKWKLLKHYCRHHRHEMQCRFCDVTISDSKKLYKHERSFHFRNGQNLNCIICGRIFKNQFSLKFHESRHSVDLNLCCTSCELSFTNVITLENHLLENHRENINIYNCSKCNKGFKNYNLFRIHRIYGHENNKLPYECRLCCMKFSNSSLRVLHRRKVHREQYVFNCNVCHMFSTNKFHHYKQHMNLHLRSYPYHCKKCLKYFTTKSRYADHKFRVHCHRRLHLINSKQVKPINYYREIILPTNDKLGALDGKLNNSNDEVNHVVENNDVNYYQCYQPIEDKPDIR